MIRAPTSLSVILEIKSLRPLGLRTKSEFVDCKSEFHLQTHCNCSRNFPTKALAVEVGVQNTWGSRERGGVGSSIHAEMVEAVPGKVAGLAVWIIDVISDAPHGKRLWRNGVEISTE
jgi:hypothetical protein